jgi:hypothetical protein
LGVDLDFPPAKIHLRPLQAEGLPDATTRRQEEAAEVRQVRLHGLRVQIQQVEPLQALGFLERPGRRFGAAGMLSASRTGFVAIAP